MGSDILRLMAFFDLKNHSGKVLSFQKVDRYKEGGGGGGGGENITCAIYKCDIYWLFTPLRYTFTIILIFYHKFHYSTCSCGMLRLLRFLLSFLPDVVYLLVCLS